MSDEEMQQEDLDRLASAADAIGSDRARIEATLEQHIASAPQVEAREALMAAKSPLALIYELIGCEYATMHFEEGQAIPRYEFSMHPCIYGKRRPDQDCRDCAHVMYHRMGNIGTQLPMYEKRYPNAGVVIPITEEEADALTDFLEGQNVAPLTRHASKIHALKTALNNATARENEARARAASAQQGRGLPPAPQAR